MIDTQVLVVGAGPVGLSLAVDLGQRGIRTVLIEKRSGPAFLPKMERVNARTMEIYRRMGLAKKVRAAGLDRNVPMDVYIVLDLTHPPLLRLPYPSVAEAETSIRATTDGTAPLEPYQLISQYTLEPLLKREAEVLPSVDLRWSTEYLSHEQDPDGITTTVRTVNGGTETIRSTYLVGCDGGSSACAGRWASGSRRSKFAGFARASTQRGSVRQNPIGNGPGHVRHYHVADEEATFLIMQDSTKYWTVHASVDSDAEMERQFEKRSGFVNYKMLSCNPWRQNLLLAERYQDRRVFWPATRCIS